MEDTKKYICSKAKECNTRGRCFHKIEHKHAAICDNTRCVSYHSDGCITCIEVKGENNLKELERKYIELGEEIQKLKEKQEKIYVPENMFFISNASSVIVQNLGNNIGFYKGYDDDKWYKEITGWETGQDMLRKNKEKELELVKVSVEEMKDGNFYIYDTITDPNYYREIAEDIESYELKIGNKLFCYDLDNDVVDVSGCDKIRQYPYVIYEVRRV